MVIGIFGGTFDPVHLGHLAIADDVANAFGLAKVLFVPNARSPLRRAPVASPSQRFEMCELATSDNVRFSPFPGWISIGMVRLMQSTRSGFLEPSIEIASLPLSWVRTFWMNCEAGGTPDALLGSVLMIVVDRPGVDGVDADIAASEVGCAGRIVMHRAALMDVSSTDIRHRIRKGLSCRDLLHPRVYDYLRHHRIYERPRAD